MPPPEKKRQRLEGHQCNDAALVADNNNNDFLASIENLSGDVIGNIFGFLLPQEIMRARLNRKLREAAKITIVPLTDFVVDSLRKYNAMSVIAAALPNLQRIALGYLGDQHKYVDGEDPDEEEAVRTVNYTTHDVGIIASFTNLRELKIEYGYGTLLAPLNGRYPCFFNFPHLQKLTILHCKHLKLNLGVLAGLPSLKELNLSCIKLLNGNLNSLRALKDTLEKLEITCSYHVEGNFMDLADFPRLKELDLCWTAVTGGIQDIGEKDFPSLTVLALLNGNGGVEQVFQRISDAQDVARIPYLFQKQRPEIVLKKWYAKLSDDSPDSYEFVADGYEPDFDPVFITLVRAGSRCGYRWENAIEDPCEVNWLDPEPDRESSDYGKYMEELQEIVPRGVNYFEGFYQRPAQEEFERILERMHRDLDDGFDMDSELESDDDEMEGIIL